MSDDLDGGRRWSVDEDGDIQWGNPLQEAALWSSYIEADDLALLWPGADADEIKLAHTALGLAIRDAETLAKVRAIVETVGDDGDPTPAGAFDAIAKALT